MRGQKLPADLVEKAAAIYGENGNLAETAHLYAAASGLPCLADCPVCVGRRRMARARKAGTR